MSFGGLILTARGRQELAKAEMGEALEFDFVGVGDGSYAGSVTAIEEMAHELHKLPVISVTRDGGQVIVDAELSSSQLAEGFYLREIGVYANGILYAYDNAGADAEYIDAAGSAVAKQKRIRAVFEVSAEAAVSVSLDSGLYALQTELEAEVLRAKGAEEKLAFSKGQYGVCGTDGYVPEKEVAIPGFALAEGVRVAVKFEDDATAEGLKLNVSGTGAIPIVYDGGSAHSQLIKGGGVYGFVYDGQSWVMEGAEQRRIHFMNLCRPVYKGIFGNNVIYEMEMAEYPAANYEGLVVLKMDSDGDFDFGEEALLTLVSGFGSSSIYYGMEPLKACLVKAGTVLTLVYNHADTYMGWHVVSIENGARGGGTLWSGALFEGGSVEFEVPAYYVRGGHLDLVVDLFANHRTNAKTALATLFFDSVKRDPSDAASYYTYTVLGQPVVKLRRCDVSSDDGNIKDYVLQISGTKTRAGKPGTDLYVNTYKVKAEYLPSLNLNSELVFTRISAYVPG